MAETSKIGAELESVATGGIVAAASAIKDKAKDKYQSEINQEVDQALAARYTKDKVYSKEQTDAKIEAQIVNVATREKYATFSATTEDVSIDTILPATGLEDTIYRVANWNGTEYNTSYWAQYAWKQDTETTGHYVLLAVKNQGLDTTPTPGSLNPVSSGGVADACGYLVDNPEFMKVETDANGRIMHSVSKEDGAYYYHKLKSPTLDSMMEDMQTIKEEAEEDVRQSIEDSQEELAAHYDYYNVSKHHSVRDVVNVYTANEGWEQVEYDRSLAQYDELDIYQVGETCNFGGDTEHSYEATISQRGVAPATITQEYETRTKFTLEEALAVLPEAVISAFAAGQKICFVDLDDFVEEWQITEAGTWERISPYDINDPEGRLEVKTDADDKIIAYRKSDGTWVECVGIEAPNLGDYVEKEEGKGLIDDGYAESKYTIDDPERRLEIKTDLENKIVHYRDEKGVLHENIGIDTPTIRLSKTGIDKLSGELKVPNLYKSPNLPKYGITNIKTETFYLTAYQDVQSIDDVVCIQDYDDTAATANDRMTICHYYVKGTLTANGDGTYSINENSVRLRHFAARKVKLNSDDNKYYAKDTIRKVSGVWYYADTLGYNGATRNKVIDDYTEIYNGETPASGNFGSVNIEVTQIVGAANINAWTVEDWDFNAVNGTDIGKKYGHQCIADVDLGHYLSKTDAAIEVKWQGNSTQGYRKRNLRYTFYKNATFAKKDKIKIGEMLRLSKFNLKANWNDNTRIKELILYRIFSDIWHHRPIVDRYDWDNKTNGLYCGATGNIHGFPVRVDVNGNFYGIYCFDLPKDGSNYMINDKKESTGLFLSGAHNTTNDWGVTLPYVIADHYDSEMDSDDLSDYPGIVAALTEWTHFINNRLYKGNDNNSYNSTELTDVDGTMYVTSTLEGGEVVETSVSAELIEFDRENIPERLDVLGFIDYMICMQTFVCYDNQHNNMLVYSGPDKKKIFPFFYDLDIAIVENRTDGAQCDIFADGVSLSNDMSLWRNLRDIYWDDMVNRYCELRKTYLSLDYIRSVYEDITKNIPASDFDNERTKWGSDSKPNSFESKLSFLTERIQWLDERYFNI